jgi:hypothetical protein
MGEVSKRLNAEGAASPTARSRRPQLAALIGRIADGTISNNAARQVFDALWSGEGGDVDAAHRGQGPEADERQRRARAIVDEVLAANAKSVEEFRAGKDKAFNALVGQVMKASKGKANPAQVNELLAKRATGRCGSRSAWSPSAPPASSPASSASSVAWARNNRGADRYPAADGMHKSARNGPIACSALPMTSALRCAFRPAGSSGIHRPELRA